MRIIKLRKQGDGSYREMAVITDNSPLLQQKQLVQDLTGQTLGMPARPIWKALNDSVAVKIEY